MTDEELVLQYRENRDPMLAAELYSRYRAQARLLALRISHGPYSHLAEDCEAIAISTLFRAALSYDLSRGPFARYWRICAHSYIRDFLQKERAEVAESLEALAERRGDRPPHPLASPDPAATLERQELYQQLLVELTKLPPRARLIFDLRSRGMSFRDISRYLDISSSQAARIHRVALRKLCKELLSYVRAA